LDLKKSEKNKTSSKLNDMDFTKTQPVKKKIYELVEQVKRLF